MNKKLRVAGIIAALYMGLWAAAFLGVGSEAGSFPPSDTLQARLDAIAFGWSLSK